ncbi:MAG: hypothetical protein BWY78_00467 [Alphaproteobacteria bacterium ADurb.Bin438]|nr:MAG: hypothetical protein BWY78_00467 [Alphaproteobacteria bacterium ADurb.Bin438]
MKTNEQVINLAKKTLSGDIRDFLVDRLRQFPKPWQKMTEAEQEREIESASKAAENLITEALRIISSNGRDVVVATLDKLTIKDGIKVEASTGIKYLQSIGEVVGQEILIVTNSVNEFVGESKPCKADPDQPELFNQEYQDKEEGGLVDEIVEEENDESKVVISQVAALPAPSNDENKETVEAEFEEVNEDNETSKDDEDKDDFDDDFYNDVA